MSAKIKSSERTDRVLIRPWPKVVFFYPTMVFCLVAWFLSSLFPKVEGLSQSLGLFFMIIFFVNLLVFAFDFNRIKSITLIFGIIAIVFALVWANSQWGIWSSIQELVNKIDIRMNTQFYGFLSFIFCLVFAMVFLNTRFNYYEINRNEILHHHGYLGDINRTPTTAMRMQKEIYDLMEYALLRSGRLIFYPATSREAIVIDNVLKVNQIEDRIKKLLSSVSVAVHNSSSTEVAGGEEGSPPPPQI
ncbi:MAG TPA: hypothetical protein ENK02_04535 [Planctomycetes bacterium]|nr:hypothetical protein [Planctomycetota bacterium]